MTPPSAAAASAPAVQPHFVRLGDFDFARLVPPPAAPESVAGRADLEVVRQAEAWRTEAQVAWAKRVERDDVFKHDEVLGAWFAAEKLPLAASFFRDMAGDFRALDAAAKKPFLRARPTTLDPKLRPCVTIPASTSYPSGSAMQAFVWAELLAEALPAQREALLARAHRAGWGRVIGGVHFPSDLIAGRMIGDAYLAAARKNPDFVAQWEKVRREIAAAASAAAR
jgi:acid phosphatase (class A)